MITYLVSYITLYLIIVNAAGLALMLADKYAAEKSARRIPEATLLGVAYAGGCFGVFFGMLIFRHKTQHSRFQIGVPLVMGAYFLVIAGLAILLKTIPKDWLLSAAEFIHTI